MASLESIRESKAVCVLTVSEDLMLDWGNHASSAFYHSSADSKNVCNKEKNKKKEKKTKKKKQEEGRRRMW